MIERASRPKLAAKVRLRFDGKTGKHMLLYPEKGLVLNGTGSEIAKLCTGEHTVEAMLLSLQATFGDSAPSTLESEVMSFLQALEARGLLEVLP